MIIGPREAEGLNFIKEFSRKHLCFPLREHIAHQLKVSHSSAQNLLKSLEARGDVIKMDHYHFRLAPKHVKAPKKSKK